MYCTVREPWDHTRHMCELTLWHSITCPLPHHVIPNGNNALAPGSSQCDHKLTTTSFWPSTPEPRHGFCWPISVLSVLAIKPIRGPTKVTIYDSSSSHVSDWPHALQSCTASSALCTVQEMGLPSNGSLWAHVGLGCLWTLDSGVQSLEPASVMSWWWFDFQRWAC